MHALGATDRRAAEHLRFHVAAGGGELREIFGAVQHAASRLDPVVDEHRLHLRDHRPFGLEVGFAPGWQSVAAVAPLDAHAHAAGEPDLAVDDQHLAVRAVVEPAEVIPGRRVVDLQVASGGARRREQRVVHGARAQPVEQHVHLHAATRGLRQFIDERGADRIAKHEGLERDVGLRGANRVDHRRIDLRAVDQRRDLVAGEQWRAQQDAQRAAEVRITAGVQAARTIEQPLFGGGEIRADPQHERGDEQGGEDDRDDGHVNNLQMRKDRKRRGMHLTHIAMILCYRRHLASA